MRLLAPLEPIAPADPSWTPHGALAKGDEAVRCQSGEGDPGWLRAPGWRAFARASPGIGGGEALETFRLDAGGTAVSFRDGHGDVVVPFGLADAYAGYTAEHYAGSGKERRLSPAALNAFYRVKRAIPRRAQVAGRRALIRWQGLPEFPAWPIDSSVADLLRFWIRCELIAREERELRFRWFWPDGARAALVLTHDVESAAGLRNAVRIADLEEERGLRSSFNLVAAQYPIDWGVVRELTSRGFELGLHGVFHDRSMFSSRAEFDRQQPALREMAERLGAEGFRSPATHRVHDWLAELPVSYDCTVPISDPYEPQPGGCCSPWPYFIGAVVELPWTLPQDNTTFTLLRERSIDLWMRGVKEIEGSFGLVQCLSHPDPGYLGEPDREALYVEFLDAVARRPGLWRALPREVASWWRSRDAGLESAGAGIGLATLDEAGSVALMPCESAQYESQSLSAIH